MNQKPLVASTFVALGLLTASLLFWHENENVTGGNSEVKAKSGFEYQKCLTKALPNCFEVAPGIYSGGQPDGAKGFKQLSRMGIQTVISVDGARPHVQLAEQFDLKYVHLPHGYDGISEHHAAKLAKAVGDLDGPIYIHCHHGKHRSPAAVAVACIGLGMLTTEQGQQFLHDAGTSKHYKGLYRSVAQAERIDEQALNQMEVDLPSISPPSQLVDSMVSAEKHFDALVRFAANDWQPLSEHPDLDAAHEALLLMEQFAELLRTETYPGSEYVTLLERSKQSSQELHELLNDSSEHANFQVLRAGELVNAIKQDCRSCHRQFRD